MFAVCSDVSRPNCYQPLIDARGQLIRDGVRLAYLDAGGDGPSVLLLHGLAGHAAEWEETVSWLTPRYRVVAADARGHGDSERGPPDVSRDALVADAAFLIEELRLKPAIVIGQSLGGLTALTLAARRPELTRALVLVEASPTSEVDDAKAAAADIRAALTEWPVPFPSRADAHQFFATRFGKLAADPWTRSLEEREDGWWARFDIDVMVEMLRQGIAEPSWQDWERIACPTLVVVAGNGSVGRDEAEEMTNRHPNAQLVEIASAGHDLHLDSPEDWRRALSAFLDALGPPPPSPRSPPASGGRIAR
jgi:pimeloyl-ACP methyl ester carboxylesterase